MTDTIDFHEARRKAQLGLPKADDVALGDTRLELKAIDRHQPVFRDCEAGQWRHGPMERSDGLPEGCPVVPLGRDGDGFWFLSAFGSVFCLKENAGKGNVSALFSPYEAFVVWAWPRMSGTGKNRRCTGNFEAEEARSALFAAATEAGAYDPMKRVRGRGAWRAENGKGLVLHQGNMLLVPTEDGLGHKPRPVGVYENKAYPTGPDLPPPAASKSVFPGDDRFEAPGGALLETYESWLWARGKIDARLMLGWVACALVGGALRWRPYVFATGDAGAGKSTLIKFTEAVLGGEQALLRSEDATEAGVAQTLGMDSVPVLLDELEPSADNTRAESMVRMARRAASETLRLRGGADGNSSLTLVRACMMFAAITMPTLEDQDLTRMAILSMSPFPEGQKRGRAPNLSEAKALGRALMRQLIDWFAYDRETGLAKFDDMLEAWRNALIHLGGHDDRGADTFGFLLAGAWAACHDRYPEPDEVKSWVEGLKRDELAEYENIQPGWKRCLNYLFDAQPKALERQDCATVREILDGYKRRYQPDLGLRAPADDQHLGVRNPADDQLDEIDTKWVVRQLKKVGLSLVDCHGGPARAFDTAELFVPNTRPALSTLFEGTRWRASTREASGSWGAALRGAPQAIVRPHRIGSARGVAVRLKAFMTTKAEERGE